MLWYKVGETGFIYLFIYLVWETYHSWKKKPHKGIWTWQCLMEYYLFNGPKYASNALDHWRGAPRAVSMEHKHTQPFHSLDINQLWQHSPIGYISPFHPIRFITKAPVEIPQNARHYLYCSVIHSPTPTLHYPHPCTTLIKPHSLNTHYRLVKTFLVNDSQ